MSLFLFSDALPCGDEWKQVCFVPVADHFAGKKKKNYVLVLGVTWGNDILDPYLYFISGTKCCERCCKIMVISWEGPGVSNIMNSGSL